MSTTTALTSAERDELRAAIGREWRDPAVGVTIASAVMPAVEQIVAARVAEALAPIEALAEEVAEAHEDGVRQAISWLRDAYPYGTGPEWRENGAEWIEERLAEHRRAALPAPEATS